MGGFIVINFPLVARGGTLILFRHNMFIKYYILYIYIVLYKSSIEYIVQSHYN